MFRGISRHSRCILVIVGAVIIWFSPWWAGGRLLAPLDILNEMMQPWRGASEEVRVKNHTVADGVTQYLIYRQVAADSYRREGWMGWSTLKYGGSAEYANTMALYYDWTMQLHRWLDFWTGWHMGIMLQILIAAIGMYFVLGSHNICGLWSTTGALLYAANSQFAVWIHHRWTVGAFCWVPWIVFAASIHRSGTRAAWFLVPVFSALAMLGGTLQHTGMVLLVLAILWSAEAFGLWRDRASGSSSPPWFGAQARLLLRYGSWTLFACGLAGLMILPCTEAFLTSSRLGLHTVLNGMNPGGLYPEGFLQPILNAISYPFHLFPSILGSASTLDGWKVFKSKLCYVTYFGTIPMIIAATALFRRRVPPASIALMIAGLLLPLTPLVRYFYQRLHILFILGGIIAFAHFMQFASPDTKRRLLRRTLIASVSLFLLWIILSIAIYWQADSLEGFLASKFLGGAEGSAFGYFRDWMSGRFGGFFGNLFVWAPAQVVPLLLFGGSLAALALSISSSTRVSRPACFALSVLLIVDCTVLAAGNVVYCDPQQHPAYPATPESDILLREVGKSGRVHIVIKEGGGHMAVTPFVPNTLSAYGIASSGGYDSIVPDGMWLECLRTHNPVRLGVLGVTHLVTYPGNPIPFTGWNEVSRTQGMVLYENPEQIPRYVGFSSRDQMTAFLEMGRNGTSFVSLHEQTGHENSRRLKVPEGVRWVRIAENQENGWQFRTSDAGDWHSVERGPDKSIVIDLGESDRERDLLMRYRPPLRRVGFFISGISLLALFLTQVVIVRRGVSSSISSEKRSPARGEPSMEKPSKAVG